MRWALTLAFALAPSSQQQILDAQNAVRAHVGLPPLAWSDTLSRAAEEWADTLIKDGTFRHNPHPHYGENLYAITGGEFLPQQIVNGWAAESKDYDHRTNRCKPDRICGHYTQIVWRDTKEVGCGVARGGGREVWVCEYWPPGNWAGMRPY
jgi:pathogenesis-related protein 1